MSTHTSLPIRTVTDPDVKATYAVDESVGATAPSDFEVVRARDLADVVEVMRWAHETRTPVVPQGARSSLTGSSVAIEGGVVLNTEGLDAITTIDPLEGLAVLGPGVVTKDPQGRRRRARACSTRPTPRARRSAPSAATSPPTPAACAA